MITNVLPPFYGSHLKLLETLREIRLQNVETAFALCATFGNSVPIFLPFVICLTIVDFFTVMFGT